MSGAPKFQRCVLMGDPAHFSVQGGANPHTRDKWGRRRHVDRDLAIEQWGRLKDTLTDLGVRVLVVPPDPAQPGLVYPANAGFMRDVDAEQDQRERLFYLANLLPTRAGEFRVCHKDQHWTHVAELKVTAAACPFSAERSPCQAPECQGDLMDGFGEIAIARGGHVRVGIEDYGGPRTPRNEELVAEIVALGRRLGRPPARHDEVASLLAVR